MWLTPSDLFRMAEELGMTEEQFIKRYTRSVRGRLSLLENPTTYDCIFLTGKRCRLYGARPKQCRTFPWWKENVSSLQAWKETGLLCEGIDHPDAPLIPRSEILAHLSDQNSGR